MYSQIGQDKWVCDFFHSKKKGYFLDLGAFDGIQISNTYYLESVLNWTGICVEAGKTNFELLKKNRNCLCLNYALAGKNGKVSFKENWTVGKIEKGGELTDSITIKKLLSKFHVPKKIDYISLDIEGSEYEVLKLFPFNDYRVILWTIEHNSQFDNGKMKMQIRKLMTENNYFTVPDSLKPDAAVFEDWFINNKNL
jgi:FkbM family methyltransferase